MADHHTEKAQTHKRGAGLKDPIFPGIAASIFGCFTALFFAPMDMYLNNIGDMWFEISVIWQSLLAMAGIASIAAAAILLLFRFIDGRLYRVVLAVGLGVSLAFYVQGYFLNMGAAALEGQEIAWNERFFEMAINAAIWFALFLAPFIACTFMPRHFTKITGLLCILLILMQLTSLVTTLFSVPLNREKYYMTKDGQFELGTDENIIVFLTDCIGTDYFDEMMEKDPEQIAFLEGFTYYPNMVGSYRRTAGAYTYLITGEYYLNRTTLAEHLKNAATNDTFWRELKALGYSVRLSEKGGAVYVPENQELFDNLVTEEAQVSSRRELFAALYKMTGYRFAPMMMKPFLYSDFLDDLNETMVVPKGQPAPYRKRDMVFFEDLNEEGLTTVYEKAFRLYFLQGAHAPYIMNAEAEKVSDGNYYEQMLGTYKIIGEYVKKLKDADLYDGATIVIVADHSIDEGNTPGSPSFLVKPRGASGPLAVSGAPASHEDFRATIMKAAGGDYEKYGKPADEWQEGEERVRKYYRYTAVSAASERFRSIDEWEVVGDARDLNNFKRTGVVYGTDGTKTVEEPE